MGRGACAGVFEFGVPILSMSRRLGRGVLRSRRCWRSWRRRWMERGRERRVSFLVVLILATKKGGDADV